MSHDTYKPMKNESNNTILPLTNRTHIFSNEVKHDIVFRPSLSRPQVSPQNEIWMRISYVPQVGEGTMTVVLKAKISHQPIYLHLCWVPLESRHSLCTNHSKLLQSYLTKICEQPDHRLDDSPNTACHCSVGHFVRVLHGNWGMGRGDTPSCDPPWALLDHRTNGPGLVSGFSQRV